MVAYLPPEACRRVKWGRTVLQLPVPAHPPLPSFPGLQCSLFFLEETHRGRQPAGLTDLLQLQENDAHGVLHDSLVQTRLLLGPFLRLRAAERRRRVEQQKSATAAQSVLNYIHHSWKTPERNEPLKYVMMETWNVWFISLKTEVSYYTALDMK